MPIVRIESPDGNMYFFAGEPTQELLESYGLQRDSSPSVPAPDEPEINTPTSDQPSKPTSGSGIERKSD
jgi:hypothetical protein